MIILGLDQAVKGIGWAYGEPGSVPTRGWHENPDYGNNTARLGKHVREWLLTFGKSIGVDRIYFEQVFVRKHGLDMPVLYKQLAVVGGIETAADNLDLLDDTFQVQVIKWRQIFFAGARPTKGADTESEAWKNMALAQCAREGWLTDDHNVAEACGIWVYGCCHSDRQYYTQRKLMGRRQELERERATA
jgi:hypothetical protein